MPITMHKRCLLAIQWVVSLLWVSTAWAAQVTISNTISSVPTAAWLMVFVLSTVSSVAALLQRLKVDTPPRFPIFIASHVLGSWLAGLLCFMGIEAYEGINDFMEVVLVSLASYAGAALMDKASASFMSRVAGQLETGNYGTPPSSKP